MSDLFFTEQREQSQIKAEITSKYFFAWATVMFNQRGVGDIAYIDLFAGPGRYKDGAKSTPLLILERAIAEPKFHERLISIFNDKDEANCKSLESDIAAIPGIEKLRHKPQVYNEEVGTEIVQMFEKMRLVPTLLFVDPFGYKGLSLRLINSVLKDWGCECIFFFNYNRISMGMNNSIVKSHMQALFGEAREQSVGEKIQGLNPELREMTIVEELCKALLEMGGKHTLPFRFRNAAGTRTSHHLVFVSKHPLGYNIMKNIMAKESSTHEQGVPLFEYNPASWKTPLLYEFSRPLDDLEEMLLATFAGQSIKMIEIFNRHSIGRRYIQKNYKDALLKLEIEGRISADPPYTQRKKQNGEYTFGDKVVVSFPNAEKK